MDFSAQRDFAVRLGCQLAATLRLPIDEGDDRWIEAVKELTYNLTHQEAEDPQPRSSKRWQGLFKSEVKPSHLIVANAVWLQKGFPIESDYEATARDDFQALVKELDFAGQPADSCKTVNHWAKQNTHGKITEVLSPAEIGDLTRLILSNATYFKDDWALPFERRDTHTKPFHLPDGGKVRVPMMRRDDEFLYCKNTAYQAVELPYNRGSLSMVVVLPKKMKEFEAGLTPESFDKLIDSFSDPVLVHLELPRWELRDDLELRDPLEAIGLTGLFDSNADLSGISKEPEIFVSRVKHVTFVQVDEQGTEAAAVTVIHVAVVSALHARKPKPAVMIVDRPFWFFIRDRESGCLLFSGRVEDPS